MHGCRVERFGEFSGERDCFLCAAGGFQRGNGEFAADKISTVLVTFLPCRRVKGGSRTSELVAGAGLLDFACRREV